MADKPKFTPGPWSAEKGRISWKIMPPEPGHCVAYMDVEHSGWWPDENPEPSQRVAANAALIAAAPEMYEALRFLYAALVHDRNRDLPFWKEASAALAKAEGRS